METFSSSTRSIATSQATAVASAANFGEQKQARAALLDITNDSPIVGLTTALPVPPVKALISATKCRVPTKMKTPGSGEEVLRGQVRTLLQKVEEEESELASKLAPFAHSCTCHELTGLARIRSKFDALFPSDQDVQVCNQAEPLGSPECKINRALMFDSPEKSGVDVQESRDDDCDMLGELCEGMKKMSMADDHEVKPLRLPEFTGKHTRFIYGSDYELEGEEVVDDGKAVSPGVLMLKGLPVPEGKHLRFHDEDEEED